MERGSTAVVTGGAGGIGKRIAELLLEAGMRVVVCDFDAKAGGVFLSEQGNSRLVFVQGDLRQSGTLARVLKQATQHGNRLTLWVNNAGIAQCPFEIDTLVNGDTSKKWKTMVEINFLAMIEGTQLAADHMMANHGSGVVINVASMAGLIPTPMGPIYAATKGGIVHFSRAAASSLGGNRSSVRVYAVCPSYTDTTLVRNFGDEVMAAMKDMPGNEGRMLAAQDVALGVLEFAAGAEVGRAEALSDIVPSAQNMAPNGSVMRIIVRKGAVSRDLFRYPPSQGGPIKRAKL